MSTPPEPSRRPERPALEPTDVRPHPRSDSLSELLRRVREKENGTADVLADRDRVDHDPVKPGAVAVAEHLLDHEPVKQSPVPGHPMGEDQAEQMPLAAASPASRPRSWRCLADGAGLSRAVIAVAVAVVALLGFTVARLLPGDGPARAAQAPVTPPPPSTSDVPVPPRTGVDPDGAGTLREGARGPAVAELEQRLLRVPDVYTNGATSGTYDAALTAAVSRFQVWYDIRGDETGVYGNDTRVRLESLTAAVGG